MFGDETVGLALAVWQRYRYTQPFNKIVVDTTESSLRILKWEVAMLTNQFAKAPSKDAPADDPSKNRIRPDTGL